nr:hypothetical protein [Stutzerimonas stutzeri]
MDLLLCGSFDSDERDAWLVELQRAMPDTRWRRTPGASSPPWLPTRRQAPCKACPGCA